ncbi:MAG: excinuclease ABC subunit UvrA [Anaerolineales bacterium]|nr:excinuclease ABC subunit UvrA [Anaerolineales bacterium]
MSQNKIIVRGAREHNLKNVDVEIPRDKMVVITGLSGSGKSSLAFDTIFAEGQRRYVESLSAYARQFLGLMEKPDVDQIEGLSPAVSIDQKGVSHNPRSTVGTVTEIYDYLRLLYARVGKAHCPTCGEVLEAQTSQQIVDRIMKMPDGSRIQVLAPIIKDRKGRHEKIFKDIQEAGFVRARVNGEVFEVDTPPTLDRYKMHTIEIVVDRLVIRHEEDPEERQSFITRLTDSIETALDLGDQFVVVNDMTNPDQPVDHPYSELLACPYGHGSFPEVEPRTFSFNSPHGACSECQGLGVRLEIDPNLVVPDGDLSLEEGAIQANGWPQGRDSYTHQIIASVCDHYKISFTDPWSTLTDEQQKVILYGNGGEKIPVTYTTHDGEKRVYRTTFEGVVNNLERRYNETTSDWMRNNIEEIMAERPCPTCQGKRLNPWALSVTLGGVSIHEATAMPVKRLAEWVEALDGRNGREAILTSREIEIVHQVLKEIASRVGFMVNVGLDYLTLNRAAGTLSGGEAQRIRLATQIGSRLTGVLYVLDEPSIGLHQRDNDRLIHTLLGMRDLGNTLLVVEHDDETMRAADYIIDMGPGAGEHGGQVVATGTPEEIMQNEASITGAFLSGRRRIPIPEKRREGNGLSIVIHGARENNLKNVDAEIPLGKLVVITGVSGSGKSSLMVDVLYKSLAQKLYRSKDRPGDHDSIENLNLIDKVINIDQSPIGRTPRSNPATYTKMFDDLRRLFAQLPESGIRGYTAGRFSFNVKGGRCENCQGQGLLRIEMQFLPDVYVDCDVCHGTRYNRETLQVKYKGHSIADVLNLTVTEAMEVFEPIPNIYRRLETLEAVGLGYIRIGQSATTLSGGEAQRVKLSRELSKRSTGQTLYVLDEPSTGLHAADVEHLIVVLQTLVDRGNSVLIIEHNPDIIKTADWLIDLGPEGGDDGGQVIAVGTPEDVAAIEESYTGQYIRPYLVGER